LGSVADVREELRKKQHQQNRLHHQISELEKRRKRSVEFADELSGVVTYTARLYHAAIVPNTETLYILVGIISQQIENI
jgi:hypothetical protein